MKKLPETMFEEEYDAARDLGFPCYVFDEDASTMEEGLESLPEGSDKLLYRGWILTEQRYEKMQKVVESKGYNLVNSSTQYAFVTYFHNYYPKIKSLSPPAVWTYDKSTMSAWIESRKLGNGPFVIKDHIKSAKYKWNEACFIPKYAGREQFEYVANNLLEHQGKLFARGFVVKQYLPLKKISDKLYPECEECRMFFLNNDLIAATHYHRRRDPDIDFSPFIEIAMTFNVPFFSMDIAQTEKGDWTIVDVGSGECSDLPPNLDPVSFYKRLQV
jgi:hypothetical protein